MPRVTINIDADRHVPCIREFAFVEFDFTGATLNASIRLYPDAPGAALLDLSTVTLDSAQGIEMQYAGTDTIANHIAAGRLNEVPPGYASNQSVLMSSVRLRINKTSMEALPESTPPGDIVQLYWDLHITPSGGDTDNYCGGNFNIVPGASNA